MSDNRPRVVINTVLSTPESRALEARVAVLERELAEANETIRELAELVSSELGGDPLGYLSARAVPGYWHAIAGKEGA